MRFTPSIVQIETSSLRFRGLLFWEKRRRLRLRLRMVLSRLEAAMGRKGVRIRVLKTAGAAEVTVWVNAIVAVGVVAALAL